MTIAEPERILGALLDVYEVPGFVVDADGRYLDVMAGDRGGELLYADADELRGQCFHDVLPETTADRFLETVEKVLASGGTRMIEYDLEVKAGRRWFEASVTPLRPVDEPPEATVWVARDVTDRRARQRRLEEQNAKIAALHDVAADIETCETPDAVYELVVDAAEDILALDIAIADERRGEVLVPQAVSSAPSDDQYYEETPVDAEANLAAETYRTGEPSIVEDLQRHAAAPADTAFRSALTVPIGEYGVFQSVSEAPGAFDDRDLELVEMLLAHARARLAQFERERQLRERTEALNRQNERLDQFASVVSHDLRTPLSVAQGNLELAREETDSEHHEEVAGALARMERMVDDLLALAREGEQIGELGPVALAEAVGSCWDAVAPDASTLAIDTDQTIRADPDRLQQLLENLVGNAIDHGGEEVAVTVGPMPDGFYVADDGPGIQVEEREEVFGFGYSTSADGTGFGLAIVEEVAEAHGWDVAVTESETGGARFEVTGVDVVEP